MGSKTPVQYSRANLTCRPTAHQTTHPKVYRCHSLIQPAPPPPPLPRKSRLPPPASRERFLFPPRAKHSAASSIAASQGGEGDGALCVEAGAAGKSGAWWRGRCAAPGVTHVAVVRMRTSLEWEASLTLRHFRVGVVYIYLIRSPQRCAGSQRPRVMECRASGKFV